ncbi:hypothetical protein ADEAN_000437700 [Angomonas deanei]|uniref:Uncharacterized protein n=1 Tax=Angomonas deanei TaxID=59799 RepID=A0A7G2CBL1_9TRYP|nr:hypothetical protein ADEAN_000437700 [Angomonas deanei]
MVMCLADGDVSDQNQTLQESVYHYQNQHNSALQSFVKEMPLPVKMSWRLPSRFYQLQLFFSVCGGRIEWMGSAVASLLQQVWSSPLRQAAFEQTYAFIVWSYQTICELTVLGWESIQTLWDVELFRFLLEELKEFCLGVSQSLLHMLATVGRGIGYLWHLEWCVVQGILQQSYHLIQLLTRHLPLRQLAVVPVSLGKIVLWGVEQAAYIVVPSLHTVLWRIPKQLFLLDIQVDLKILSAVTVHLRVVSHALLQVLWEVFQRVSNVVLVGLRYYHETSFTTLHVASVLQTILLGMALRQDMRDLMLAEEEEARRRRQFRLDNVENMLNQAKESLLHRHVAEPLTSNRFVRRLNGIRLFIQAHRKTSMQYIIHHFIGFVSLLGLWVLPLSGKLYYFVLLYVVPYYSTKDFLSFFFHTTDSNGTPLPPPLAYTLVVFILRAVLTTIFQHTISALLYRILRELYYLYRVAHRPGRGTVGVAKTERDTRKSHRGDCRYPRQDTLFSFLSANLSHQTGRHAYPSRGGNPHHRTTGV